MIMLSFFVNKIIKYTIVILCILVLTSFNINFNTERKLNFVKACGFNRTINGVSCVPADLDELQVISKFYTDFGLPDVPQVFLSDKIEMGEVGVDSLFQTYIILNPKYVDRMNCNNKVVLYHEIGHILSYLTWTKPALTSDDELKADEFAGFRLRMDNCSKLTEVAEMYGEIIPDDLHPADTIRMKSFIKGYKKANSKIKNESLESIKFDGIKGKIGEFFKDSVSLQFIVTPHKKTYTISKKDEFFDVYMSLRLNQANEEISNLIFINSIESVAYMLDDSTFKQSVVQPKNINDDNFGYLLTKVYEHFPIIVAIKFKDESFIAFNQNFELTSKK